MDDERIIELYWNRNQDAIAETSTKYGKLCFFISRNILSSSEDSEEVVNDTYLAPWNAIPEKHPSRFSVFISRITRNLALKKYEFITAEKRNPDAVCSFEELNDCISGNRNNRGKRNLLHGHALQPVKHGSDGIWCVERVYDAAEYGYVYAIFPNEDNHSAMEVYHDLQASADEGSSQELLDPLRVALKFVQSHYGHLKATADSFEEVQGPPDGQFMF